MPVNLVPGQYQIEDLVMGKGTPYKITGFDIQPYGVSDGDYQAPRQDTKSFGFDQHTAGPLNITIEILQNWWTRDAPVGAKLSTGSLGKVQRIWKGDGVRYVWGEMQTLYFCGNDGIIKEIYGRTGKFTYPKGHEKTECYEVIGEFRRADTVSYRSTEKYKELLKGDTPTIVTPGGDAATWGRILLTGPMTNPVITVGAQKFAVEIELEEGEAAEISSYPWRRRAIDSNGVNIRNYMSGIDYLDKMRLYADRSVPIRWTSDEINTWVPEMGNRDWKVNIDDLNYFNLPDTYETLAGKPVIRFDLFNPEFAEKYIASGLFGTTSACLYKKDKYNTAEQFCQAKITEPFGGRSGIVIMSDATMTSGVMLEVVSGLGNNWLRIRNITGPTTYSAVRAEWQNTALFGWSETDVVSIEYDPDNKRYTAKLNGVEKCHWDDTTDIVPTGALNRQQGFIFDLAGGLLSQGTGFKDILAYDKAVVPAPVGKVFFLWKDAYQVIQ